MGKSKKELIKEYKENPPPMGVYQIRNLVNDKILVGTSTNLPGVFNREKFQLNLGGHPNKGLQADWNETGGDSFDFEILDELKPTENPGYDYKEDLAFLEEIWLEKLQPYGERGYNKEKHTADEKLQRIMQNRLAKP